MSQGTYTGFRTVSETYASPAPGVCNRQYRKPNSIFGLELLAPVAFLYNWRKVLSGKRIIIFVDKSASLSALIRADSFPGGSAALLAVFWNIEHEANICIFLSRCRYKLNIAELPTRRVSIICRKMKSLSFKNLFRILPDSLRWRVVV